jgi:hypothetical protein
MGETKQSLPFEPNVSFRGSVRFQRLKDWIIGQTREMTRRTISKL